jgi:phosphatidylserine/phosphatidylglycerophosphate/cardiolipin synthase-like enzyme
MNIMRRFAVSSIAPFVLLAALVASFLLFQELQSPHETPSSLPAASSGIWEIYFTDPEGPQSASLKGGPDAALVEAIDGARSSIDMAIYHLDLWSVRDALIRAYQRGVRVRLVTDDGRMDERAIKDLQKVGILVISDHGPHIMHHKFVVIDGDEVWTGSMNLTLQGAYRENNHFIRILSRELAANYQVEFDEMWRWDRFGASSQANTPNPIIDMNGIKIETYFSPDDGASSRIVELIQSADEAIDFLAYALTSDPIGEALLQRHREGLPIRGVVEASQSKGAGAETSKLGLAGIDIRLDANPENMHHKAMIFDHSIVLLGSYNFTRSAEENNDENLLIIHDPALAAEFLIEFEQIYHAAIPWNP